MSLLCAAFVLITSPVAAHALARGAHLGGVPLWKGSVVDKYEEDGEAGATPDGGKGYGGAEETE
jgi:multicomponent Na+:H+ antiporter subunit G